jgi:hypothetical protein
VGPRAVLDEVVKKNYHSPQQQSNPRTPIVQMPISEFKNVKIAHNCIFTCHLPFIFGWAWVVLRCCRTCTCSALLEIRISCWSVSMFLAHIEAQCFK